VEKGRYGWYLSFVGELLITRTAALSDQEFKKEVEEELVAAVREYFHPDPTSALAQRRAARRKAQEELDAKYAKEAQKKKERQTRMEETVRAEFPAKAAKSPQWCYQEALRRIKEDRTPSSFPPEPPMQNWVQPMLNWETK